jgi:hypothetical protein
MTKKTLITYLEFLKTEVLRSSNDKIITGAARINEIKQQVKGKRRSDKNYHDFTTVLFQIKSLV